MQVKIGDTFSVSKVMSDAVVRAFAELSGDYNPIHLDDEFAKNTRFGSRIAHGMLSGALLSAVLGNEFRERKIVYVSQSMRFVAPVFIGDAVTATATVKSIRDDKPLVTIDTTCTNQNGDVTLTGEAVVLIVD